MKQREIKFRVWNLRTKEFTYFNLTDDLRFLKNEAIGINYIYQYTGLNDKNGKEIYDGDIIQFEDERGIQRDEVIFESGRFEARKQTKRGLIFSEVIGNIYENPEL